MLSPDQVFPEYFVIRVNVFDKEKIDGYLEEWMDYLKNERIRPDTTAPGLQEARQRLDLLMMSDAERRRYERDLDTLVRDTDVMRTQLMEAEIKGRKKGEKIGMEIGEKIGMEKGMEKGEKIGLEKGMEKGRAEGEKIGAKKVKTEMARKLKSKGFGIAEIAELTGMSEADIARI